MERLGSAHGRPPALSHDRHGIFRVTPKRAARLEERLAESGIAATAAQSPHATGRRARRLGAPRGRLAIEVRLAGAMTPAAATQAPGAFAPRFNERFRAPAAEAGSAPRPPAAGAPPATVFRFT